MKLLLLGVIIYFIMKNNEPTNSEPDSKTRQRPSFSDSIEKVREVNPFAEFLQGNFNASTTGGIVATNNIPTDKVYFN